MVQGSWLQLNDQGSVAFNAYIDGTAFQPRRGGVWAGQPGDVRLIALEGQQAPGAQPGNLFSAVGEVAMNNRGAVAITARLTDSGSPYTWNAHGIWAAEPGGPLRLVTRIGDSLEVGPGEFRRIAGLDFLFGGGTDDGRPMVFNDAGQLAFYAFFDDGSSGIFLAQVPEPATSAALMAAFGAVLLRRRVRVASLMD
jgi:hypothetical protein